ncbi:MAG TPA: hypothetical protein VES61_01070 [Gaiellaceae bacterium]|nr:hypothetical protein [Gaiellaceae bacterium]
MRDDAENSYEEIIAAVKGAINAEVTKQGKCSCGKWVAVSFPDTKARTAALELWLDQGYGKPKQSMEVTLEVDLERDLKRWGLYLEQMTVEERDVMVGFLRRQVELQPALPVGEGHEDEDADDHEPAGGLSANGVADVG